MASALDKLTPMEAGRVVGAFEARGGVVISTNGSTGTQYHGIRLWIETLTVTIPLHSVFGPAQPRAAYTRPVYRYELTRRETVGPVATWLYERVFDPTRKAELACAVQFCSASDSAGRAAAAASLSALRAS